MTMQYSISLRNSINNAIVAAVGAGGLLNIYSGVPPASVDAALSGNALLVAMPCSATFGVTASGTLTVNAISQTNAVATGAASFFRFCTSGGTAVLQGTVGTAGCDLNVNTTAIVTGGPEVITSFTLPAPGA
jgi:hypothetical protein